jgi:hypothetical protein
MPGECPVGGYAIIGLILLRRAAAGERLYFMYTRHDETRELGRAVETTGIYVGWDCPLFFLGGRRVDAKPVG